MHFYWRLILTVLVLFVSSKESSAKNASKPNIVFFLVDVYVGCFGSPRHLTPYINSLAREGMLFDNAYEAACSPTCASIMTGRYSARLKMTSIIEKNRGRAPKDAPLPPPPTRSHLPLEEVTVADAHMSD